MFGFLTKLRSVSLNPIRDEGASHVADFHPVAAPGDDRSRESERCRKQGNRLLAQGNLEGAAAQYMNALAIDSGHAGAHLNIGFVLKALGRNEEARRHLEQAARIDPEMEDAFYNLGTLAQEQGNLHAAASYFNHALEIRPDFEIACRDLCRVLFQSGDYAGARETACRGLGFNPASADLHHYLGNLYLHEKDYEKAFACYEKALSIRPDYAEVHSNMGKAFLEVGKVEGAAERYRKVLTLGDGGLATEAMGCLLFLRGHQSDVEPQQYLAEAKRYGEMVAALAKPYTAWRAGHPATMPLRVGWVSGDLMNHPVGYFLENILQNLRAARIELVAYPTVLEEDDLTLRIKPCFGAWHPIAGISDEAAARIIHEDGIHILIDLAGHTSNNRLSLFAWKPAPVQVSWLGYFASTGVPGMDYLLADSVSVLESHREQFTETVWYLPDTRLCFTPPPASDKLSRTPLPALRNGYLTFGCFQNVSKLSDEVLVAWGRILSALPQARLRIQSKQTGDTAARETLLQRFSGAGIPAQRVRVDGPTGREDYLAAHAEVDAILDTFPYPGGTTTCEALWMGVPTLTLAGKTLLSRQGASLLTCTGLDDWVAGDVEEYVAKAVGLADDIERLARLRAGLRERVLASPLFDAPRFAANLEDALHEMWRRREQEGTPMRDGPVLDGRSRS